MDDIFYLQPRQDSVDLHVVRPGRLPNRGIAGPEGRHKRCPVRPPATERMLPHS